MSGAIQNGTPFPPSGPTMRTAIIPSRLYEQYSDDSALQTFVIAFNVMAQWWMNWFSQIALPVWSTITGALLDWIATGLYGYPRPTLTFETTIDVAGYGTFPYGTLGYGMARTLSSTTFVPVSDDVYQRMLTWHLYRGDGLQYNTRWLKQRVHRFLNGANGYLGVNDNTQDVSVTYTGDFDVTITLTTSGISQIFQYAVNDGVLALPFQYNYTVVLT